MKHSTIHTSTFKYLSDLSNNNNRPWFNDHKETYLSALENMQVFVDELIGEMNKHDVIENVSAKKSLYRIYKDVRFSKDKSPYNPRFAFGLQRATKLRRGGYHMSIKPGNSFLACGFFGPNTDNLSAIRQDINYNSREWRKILRSKKIQSTFGELRGEKLATAPRGYAKDHEAIDLLRHKQFILRHDFTDKEVLSSGFLKLTNERFKAVRPFFDYMSEVLTTDANGEISI